MVRRQLACTESEDRVEGEGLGGRGGGVEGRTEAWERVGVGGWGGEDSGGRNRG